MPFGNVTYKKKFQNAQNTVELIVKTCPKSLAPTKRINEDKPYVRDCLLKKTLEGMNRVKKSDVKAKCKIVQNNKASETLSKVNKKISAGNEEKDNVNNLTWREILERDSNIHGSLSNQESSNESVKKTYDKGNQDYIDKSTPVISSNFLTSEKNSIQANDNHLIKLLPKFSGTHSQVCFHLVSQNIATVKLSYIFLFYYLFPLRFDF